MLSLDHPLITISRRELHLFAEHEELHALGALVPALTPGDVPVWLVTRLGPARQLLSDRRMSHHIGHWGALQRGEVSPPWPAMLFMAGENMLNADPPAHTRLRGILADAFRTRPVESMRPRVAGMVAALLDGMENLPRGEAVDLKGHFGQALPLEVFCALFGVQDPGTREAFRDLVTTGLDTTAAPETVEAMQYDFAHHLGRLVASKRAAPGDDLTSALVTATGSEDGAPLTDGELLGTLLLMVAAGHETTATLLVNAVRALLERPGQLELVRSGVRTWTDVIEEALRHKAPVPHMFPVFATEDIEAGGVLIRKGDPVMTALGAVGHDPGLHPGPGAFDVTRERKAHLAFGYGIHHCIGAPLAHLEAEVALPALFARFPRLALADAEPVLVSSFIVHASDSLPVILGGSGRAAD